MKPNMGPTDRAVRTILAAVMAFLYFAKIVPGTIGLILLILAVVFLATSFVRFCPLYLPFGISTLRKK